MMDLLRPSARVLVGRLVFRVALSRECQGGAIDPLPFIPHTPVVIDDQTHTQWNIFVFEQGDLLLYPIFEDLEIILPQSADRTAVFIDHRNGELNKLNIDVNRIVLVPLLDFLSGT
jgi:hypothetical protein